MVFDNIVFETERALIVYRKLRVCINWEGDEQGPGGGAYLPLESRLIKTFYTSSFNYNGKNKYIIFFFFNLGLNTY